MSEDLVSLVVGNAIGLGIYAFLHWRKLDLVSMQRRRRERNKEGRP